MQDFFFSIPTSLGNYPSVSLSLPLSFVEFVGQSQLLYLPVDHPRYIPFLSFFEKRQGKETYIASGLQRYSTYSTHLYLCTYFSLSLLVRSPIVDRERHTQKNGPFTVFTVYEIHNYMCTDRTIFLFSFLTPPPSFLFLFSEVSTSLSFEERGPGFGVSEK